MPESYRVNLEGENGGWSEAIFEIPSPPIQQSELPPALQKQLVAGVIPMLGYVRTATQQNMPAFMLFNNSSMQLLGKACTPTGKILEIEGP